MSDIKRIQLTGFGDAKKNSDVITDSSSKAPRYEISVDLFEPDSTSFPEFNYKKLLHFEKKKHKKNVQSKPSNGSDSDPFEENDQDVERIAKEFEKKYGGASGYGMEKKSKRLNLDYCDKGAGYDENDSFIDNREAYDEIIPDEIETVNGGFYINSGSLEFKNISNFERPDDAIRMPKPKKRVISSSSSNSSEDNDDDEIESTDLDNGLTAKVKNGHPVKKQKVVSSSDEHKATTKQSKIVNNKSEKPEIKKVCKKDKKEEVVVVSNELGKDKSIKTTTVKDMLRAKRDNCLLMKEGAVKSDSTPTNTDKETNEMDHESTSSSFTSVSSNERAKTPNISDLNPENLQNAENALSLADKKPKESKLPGSLPDELLTNIKAMQEIGVNAHSSGKINFFDSRVSDLLLKIDNEARACGGLTRNQIYAYLEFYLPCTKQTLLGRSKKLRLKQEEGKLLKTYEKLKQAVDEIAPSILKSHVEECDKVTQLRSQLTSEEIVTNLPKMPRRRFPWNENIGTHLFDLYNLKASSYNSAKTTDTLENFIDNYVKSDVLKIWPMGWMKIDELKKEIVRRQGSDKKPKENKKPSSANSVTIVADKELQTVVTLATNTTTNPATTITISKDSSKSVLSSSNSLTKSQASEKANSSKQPNGGQVVNSTKPEKTDKHGLNMKFGSTSSAAAVGAVPNVNFGSSLTITAVKPPSISNSSSTASSKSSSAQNKVIITNIDVPPINPVSAPNNISSLLKTDSSGKQTSKETIAVTKSISSNGGSANSTAKSILPLSAPKLPSSLSISLTTSQTQSTHTLHNAISVKDTNIISSGTTATCTSRKPSDYSINSIMSSLTSRSTSPAGNSNYSKPAKTSASSSSSSSAQNKSVDSNVHDQLVDTTVEAVKKTKSDSQLINSVVPSNKESVGNNATNILKVRSVENVNNSIMRGGTVIQSRDESFSDSSDGGVEIVGVFPMPVKNRDSKSHNHKSNKNKYVTDGANYHSVKSTNSASSKKNEHDGHHPSGGGRNSTATTISSNLHHGNLKGCLKSDDKKYYTTLHNSATDNDLDLLQIMKDLKELEELQQPKNISLNTSENSLHSKLNQQSSSAYTNNSS